MRNSGAALRKVQPYQVDGVVGDYLPDRAPATDYSLDNACLE